LESEEEFPAVEVDLISSYIYIPVPYGLRDKLPAVTGLLKIEVGGGCGLLMLEVRTREK
jgi:hypothetical protein